MICVVKAIILHYFLTICIVNSFNNLTLYFYFSFVEKVFWYFYNNLYSVTIVKTKQSVNFFMAPNL